MKKKEKEKLEIVEQVNQNRELESFWATGKVENLMENIEKEKEKVVEEIINYSKENIIPCKWNKDGEVISYKKEVNPIVISNTFFKPIVKLGCIEPEYNAEKLSLVYDYYCFLITETNKNIGYFPSSLTSFCKFASISMNTLRSYKNGSDLALRTIVNKIYDQVEDNNVTLAQLGKVNERTTIFKLKSQNEVVEKEQPKVNINIIEQPNIEQIQNRLDKYKKFANKQGKF